MQATIECGDQPLKRLDCDVCIATFNQGDFGLTDAREFSHALLRPASKPTKVGDTFSDSEADVIVESKLGAGLGEEVTY